MNRNITTLNQNITALNRNITALNWCRYFSARRVYHRVMKFCIGFYVTKILGFRPDIFLVVGGIPPPPCTMLFWWDKRDFEKSCIRILKLCVRPYVTKVLRFQKQRWLCRQVWRKISCHVDGGPSGGSSLPRPGSRDPYRRGRKLVRAAWVGCHGTKCPLLTAFFSFFLSLFRLARLLFSQKGLSYGSKKSHGVLSHTIFWGLTSPFFVRIKTWKFSEL